VAYDIAVRAGRYGIALVATQLAMRHLGTCHPPPAAAAAATGPAAETAAATAAVVENLYAAVKLAQNSLLARIATSGCVLWSSTNSIPKGGNRQRLRPDGKQRPATTGHASSGGGVACGGKGTGEGGVRAGGDPALPRDVAVAGLRDLRWLCGRLEAAGAEAAARLPEQAQASLMWLRNLALRLAHDALRGWSRPRDVVDGEGLEHDIEHDVNHDSSNGDLCTSLADDGCQEDASTLVDTSHQAMRSEPGLFRFLPQQQLGFLWSGGDWRLGAAALSCGRQLEAAVEAAAQKRGQRQAGNKLGLGVETIALQPVQVGLAAAMLQSYAAAPTVAVAGGSAVAGVASGSAGAGSGTAAGSAPLRDLSLLHSACKLLDACQLPPRGGDPKAPPVRHGGTEATTLRTAVLQLRFIAATFLKDEPRQKTALQALIQDPAVSAPQLEALAELCLAPDCPWRCAPLACGLLGFALRAALTAAAPAGTAAAVAGTAAAVAGTAAPAAVRGGGAGIGLAARVIRRLFLLGSADVRLRVCERAAGVASQLRQQQQQGQQQSLQHHCNRNRSDQTAQGQPSPALAEAAATATATSAPPSYPSSELHYLWASCFNSAIAAGIRNGSGGGGGSNGGEVARPAAAAAAAAAQAARAQRLLDMACKLAAASSRVCAGVGLNHDEVHGDETTGGTLHLAQLLTKAYQDVVRAAGRTAPTQPKLLAASPRPSPPPPPPASRQQQPPAATAAAAVAAASSAPLPTPGAASGGAAANALPPPPSPRASPPPPSLPPLLPPPLPPPASKEAPAVGAAAPVPPKQLRPPRPPKPQLPEPLPKPQPSPHRQPSQQPPPSQLPPPSKQQQQPTVPQQQQPTITQQQPQQPRRPQIFKRSLAAPNPAVSSACNASGPCNTGSSTGAAADTADAADTSGDSSSNLDRMVLHTKETELGPEPAHPDRQHTAQASSSSGQPCSSAGTQQQHPKAAASPAPRPCIQPPPLAIGESQQLPKLGEDHSSAGLQHQGPVVEESAKEGPHKEGVEAAGDGDIGNGSAKDGSGGSEAVAAAAADSSLHGEDAEMEECYGGQRDPVLDGSVESVEAAQRVEGDDEMMEGTAKEEQGEEEVGQGEEDGEGDAEVRGCGEEDGDVPQEQEESTAMQEDEDKSGRPAEADVPVAATQAERPAAEDFPEAGTETGKLTVEAEAGAATAPQQRAAAASEPTAVYAHEGAAVAANVAILAAGDAAFAAGGGQREDCTRSSSPSPSCYADSQPLAEQPSDPSGHGSRPEEEEVVEEKEVKEEGGAEDQAAVSSPQEADGCAHAAEAPSSKPPSLQGGGQVRTGPTALEAVDGPPPQATLSHAAQDSGGSGDMGPGAGMLGASREEVAVKTPTCCREAEQQSPKGAKRRRLSGPEDEATKSTTPPDGAHGVCGATGGREPRSAGQESMGPCTAMRVVAPSAGDGPAAAAAAAEGAPAAVASPPPACDGSAATPPHGSSQPFDSSLPPAPSSQHTQPPEPELALQLPQQPLPARGEEQLDYEEAGGSSAAMACGREGALGDKDGGVGTALEGLDSSVLLQSNPLHLSVSAASQQKPTEEKQQAKQQQLQLQQEARHEAGGRQQQPLPLPPQQRQERKRRLGAALVGGVHVDDSSQDVVLDDDDMNPAADEILTRAGTMTVAAVGTAVTTTAATSKAPVETLHGATSGVAPEVALKAVTIAALPPSAAAAAAAAAPEASAALSTTPEAAAVDPSLMIGGSSPTDVIAKASSDDGDERCVVGGSDDRPGKRARSTPGPPSSASAAEPSAKATASEAIAGEVAVTATVIVMGQAAAQKAPEETETERAAGTATEAMKTAAAAGGIAMASEGLPFNIGTSSEYAAVILPGSEFADGVDALMLEEW
ncbi:hypothetical protein Agub_g2136, partial [Astrephomene gubernaculifera]